MVSDKPSGPETKRDKAAARSRDKILNASMMCFLENGYHQTGVRDIAKRAGVSLGNLYNHFPGKHDVLVEIAAMERREMAPFLKLLAKSEPAPKMLDAFVAAYARHLAKPENVILTMEIASEAIRKPDIGALFLDNRNELVAALEAVIRRGIDDNSIRPVPNPNDAAQSIVELIEGAAYRCVLGGATMRSVLRGLKDFVSSAMRER